MRFLVSGPHPKHFGKGNCSSGENAVPSAHGKDPAAIVLKVTVSISPATDHFHFVVKAFNRAIAF